MYCEMVRRPESMRRTKGLTARLVPSDLDARMGYDCRNRRAHSFFQQCDLKRNSNCQVMTEVGMGINGIMYWMVNHTQRHVPAA